MSARRPIARPVAAPSLPPPGGAPRRPPTPCIGTLHAATPCIGTTLHDADDAGSAEPAVHRNAPLREPRSDRLAGAHLREAQFGMRVQVAAQRADLVVELGDTVDQLHPEPRGR
jgi:hypothetical protein